MERRARQLGGVEEAGRELALSGAAAPGSTPSRRSWPGNSGMTASPSTSAMTPIFSPEPSAAIGTCATCSTRRVGSSIGLPVVARLSWSPRAALEPGQTAGAPVRGEICVPLLDGERLLGVAPRPVAGS